MKRTVLAWLAVPPAILIATWGCAPTSYQKAYAIRAHGYSDERFSQDTFHVQFVADYTTPADILRRYLFRRAAELTVQHRFRYFAVIRDPCPLTQYRTVYQNQEDAEAAVDRTNLEFPVWGTLHMTIQCFMDAEGTSGVRLISAKAALPKGHRLRPR